MGQGRNDWTLVLIRIRYVTVRVWVMVTVRVRVRIWVMVMVRVRVRVWVMVTVRWRKHETSRYHLCRRRARRLVCFTARLFNSNNYAG